MQGYPCRFHTLLYCQLFCQEKRSSAMYLKQHGQSSEKVAWKKFSCYWKHWKKFFKSQMTLLWHVCKSKEGEIVSEGEFLLSDCFGEKKFDTMICKRMNYKINNLAWKTGKNHRELQQAFCSVYIQLSACCSLKPSGINRKKYWMFPRICS